LVIVDRTKGRPNEPRALQSALDAAGPPVEVAIRAPGRANLIGEHTDYNEGFVLPVALDLATYVAGRRTKGTIRLRSVDFPDEAVVDLGTGHGDNQGWGRYVSAVVQSLRDADVAITGFEGTVASDLPIGAGLSSSAALEVAVALALAAEALDPLRLAEICRRAENVYVGVQCGIMDQLTATSARAEHALHIDCADNSTAFVPFPRDLRVLVIDSSVGRSLDSGAYNARLTECQRAATALGVRSLRYATLEDLDRRRGEMDALAYRRARHVVSENVRVLDAIRAFRIRDLDRVRELFAESHRSLAEDFEVSTTDLDTLVEIALKTEGVVAARLTGAGFGGCTVNLVRRARAEAISSEILERYRSRTGRSGRSWLSDPTGGAGLVDTSY
jgi:galactokinase